MNRFLSHPRRSFEPGMAVLGCPKTEIAFDAALVYRCKMITIPSHFFWFRVFATEPLHSLVDNPGGWQVCTWDNTLYSVQSLIFALIHPGSFLAIERGRHCSARGLHILASALASWASGFSFTVDLQAASDLITAAISNRSIRDIAERLGLPEWMSLFTDDCWGREDFVEHRTKSMWRVGPVYPTT